MAIHYYNIMMMLCVTSTAASCHVGQQPHRLVLSAIVLRCRRCDWSSLTVGTLSTERRSGGVSGASAWHSGSGPIDSVRPPSAPLHGEESLPPTRHCFQPDCAASSPRHARRAASPTPDSCHCGPTSATVVASSALEACMLSCSSRSTKTRSLTAAARVMPSPSCSLL